MRNNLNQNIEARRILVEYFATGGRQDHKINRFHDLQKEKFAMQHSKFLQEEKKRAESEDRPKYQYVTLSKMK